MNETLRFAAQDVRWMEKGLPHGRVVEEMREDERR